MEPLRQSEKHENVPVLGYATGAPLAREGHLFREGTLLVVRDGEELPPRCVLCGADAVGKALPLVFSWDESFKVTKQKSTLELRRRGTVRIRLCRGHFQRWRSGKIVGTAGILFSAIAMIGGVVVAAVSENQDVPLWTSTGIEMLLAGFGVMILSLFVFTLRTQTLGCERIDGGFLYLSGAGEGFLRGLAEVPSERET